MSRFLVIPGRESMNRHDKSRRGGTHVGVDQLAGLIPDLCQAVTISSRFGVRRDFEGGTSS